MTSKREKEHEERRRGGKVNDHDADDGYKRGGHVEKKRKDHEKLATGGGVVARAAGGAVARARGGKVAGYPDVAKIAERGHQKRVMRKRGGKVEGKKAEHRLDKRARGGSVGGGSARHPLSGADAPPLAYARGSGPASRPEHD